MPEYRKDEHQAARDQNRKDFIDPDKAKAFEQGFNGSPDFAGAWQKAKQALGIGSDAADASDQPREPKKR